MSQVKSLNWLTTANTIGVYVIGVMVFFVITTMLTIHDPTNSLPYIFGIIAAAMYVLYHTLNFKRRIRANIQSKLFKDNQQENTFQVSQSVNEKAIESLKKQYISGSISEMEFEDQIDELLSGESESVQDLQVEKSEF